MVASTTFSVYHSCILFFENYTLNAKLVDENKSHLLTFLDICEDKHLIKWKFESLNGINKCIFKISL